MPENSDIRVKPISKLDAVRRIDPNALRDAFNRGDMTIPSRKPEVHGVIPKSAEELQQREEGAWKNFLERDIDVPLPGPGVIGFLEKAKGEGITSFSAHYFPRIKFTEARVRAKTKVGGKEPPYIDPSTVHRWNTTLPRSFWEHVATDPQQAKHGALVSGWILVDRTPIPHDPQSGEEYQDDFLAPMLEEARKKREIQNGIGGTRFHTTTEEIESVVFSRLADIFDRSEGDFRFLTPLEFNILANIHYPSTLSGARTYERLYDWGQSDSLIGATTSGGSFITLHDSEITSGNAKIGFRPVMWGA